MSTEPHTRAVFLKMLVSVIKRLSAFSRALIENEICHHLVSLSQASLSSENMGRLSIQDAE